MTFSLVSNYINFILNIADVQYLSQFNYFVIFKRNQLTYLNYPYTPCFTGVPNRCSVLCLHEQNYRSINKLAGQVFLFRLNIA